MGEGGLNSSDRAVGVVVHIVEARHVHTGDARQRPQLNLPRVPARLLIDLHHLDDSLLPIADDERIYKPGDRLRVEGRVATGDDERIPLVPLAGPQRETSQVEHLKEIGVN